VIVRGVIMFVNDERMERSRFGIVH
jgi:hypothetical protein